MQCPACKTTYTDETLRFCLADGTSLIAVQTEEPTLVRSSGQSPLRVDIADGLSGSTAAASNSSGGNVLKIILVVLLLGLITLAVVGFAGFILYYNSGSHDSGEPQTKPSPGNSPKSTPTPDDEKARLQEELANLKKKIEDKKNSTTDTSPFPTPGNGTPTARVNSPRDGFLALRSEPDAEYGDRLAKIPHGAIIELNNCEKEQVIIGGRTGRWCLVTYGDNAGYVFDAWLIY